MPDIDFVEMYRRALSRISESEFDQFFHLAEITDSHQQEVGKDFVGIAGAFYLSELQRQKKRSNRTGILKHLKSAQLSARAFSVRLNIALNDRPIVNSLAEDGTKSANALRAKLKNNPSASKVFEAVFPSHPTKGGFNYEALCVFQEVLADILEEVSEEDIEKSWKGRAYALRPWASVMSHYWLSTKGHEPKLGHYDQGTSEYTSKDMAALNVIALPTDSHITPRAIAQALATDPSAELGKKGEQIVLSSLGFSQIFLENANSASVDTISHFFGETSETLESVRAKKSVANGTGEGSIMSRSAFRETLKSTPEGRILLHALMEMLESG